MDWQPTSSRRVAGLGIGGGSACFCEGVFFVKVVRVFFWVVRAFCCCLLYMFFHGWFTGELKEQHRL